MPNRKTFDTFARLAPEYDQNSRDIEQITVLADKYCIAYDADDEYNKNIYFSALLLKFWDKIDKIVKDDRCKAIINGDYEEAFAWLCEAIMYTMKYRAWQNGTSNAQACINQCISTIIMQHNYRANLAKSRANYNTMSIDQPMYQEDDCMMTFGDTLADEDSSPEKISETLSTEQSIQRYLDKRQIIEAIIMDIMAFGDCLKEIKEVRTDVDEETGETYKYSVIHKEFWPYKCVQILSDLPEDYEDYFFNRYNINAEVLQAAMTAIRKAPNTKLYKYLNGTLDTLRASYANRD